MLNAVGRDIPQEVLDETGKTVFQGTYQFDQHEYTKAPVKAKLVQVVAVVNLKVVFKKYYRSVMRMMV